MSFGNSMGCFAGFAIMYSVAYSVVVHTAKAQSNFIHLDSEVTA